MSMNYIGQFFLLKKDLFTQIGGLHYGYSSEGLYDLLLRSTEGSKKICHIPFVLYTKNKTIEHDSQMTQKIIEEALLYGKYWFTYSFRTDLL
jgi:hypothetical protein